MALLVPKIVYSSPAVTLNFTYPPVQKPGTYELQSTRHDSTSSGGLRQSVIERTETYFTLQMDFVPASDLSNWADFFAYALTGAAFDYYPDSASGTHDSWTLDDTSWTPAYAAKQYAKFKMRIRKVISL